jgi:hypothetical protein
MFVKPGINKETGKPFHVRIPHTFAKMAETGEEVADDYFWRWMLLHKDVVPAERPPPEPEPVPAEPVPEGALVDSTAAAATPAEPEPEAGASVESKPAAEA